MAQDLRKLFSEEKEKEKHTLENGHEERFLERLNSELPKQKKKGFFFLKIAASILVLIGASFFTYKHYTKSNISTTTIANTTKEETTTKEKAGISLGDLSPDLEKIENYYVANINFQLSQLEISEENNALVDSFMKQLSSLNLEYENLNVELNEIGPNDQTITALIKNLELRLKLLQQLKKKLNQLKQSKNEQVETNVI